MGCNCKANEQILKIHKDYGQKLNNTWQDRAMFRIKETFKVLIVLCLLFIFFPITLGVLIYLVIKGKRHFNFSIILKKMVGKDKNGKV